MCRSTSLARRVGSVRQMTTRTTAPMGTLTRKIQCHPQVSVMIPPSAGPTSVETPKTAPKKPWYLPRSDGAKMSPITANATGNNAPAPRPWMPRNRMNCHISPEMLHRIEPSRKTLTPITKMIRRPKMSDSFP